MSILPEDGSSYAASTWLIMPWYVPPAESKNALPVALVYWSPTEK